jgi:hypothetical protein
MTSVAVCVVAAVIVCVPARSAAQPAASRAVAPRFIVSAGVTLEAGYPIGDRSAELRRNSPGVPSPLTLFRAESTFARAAGFDGRLGVSLGRRFVVEVGAGFAKPEIAVAISQEREGDASALVTETLSQYKVDVSGLFEIGPARSTSRIRPYLIGGAGYLRQLHEGRLVLESGRTVHAGGGVRYWLRPYAARRLALGVRGEARYVRRSAGIDFADKSRGYGALSLLGIAAF